MLGNPPHSETRGLHNFLSKGVQYGTKKREGFSYKNLVVSIIFL